MIDSFPVVGPDVIPYLLHALPSRHTGERLLLIIFVPPVSTEKVNDFFAFPCAVQLGIDSPADCPSASEAIFQTCYRPRLGVPRHILTKNIVCGTV